MPIFEAIEPEQLARIWPVMRELRDQLDEERFLDLVTEMRPSGYRIYALEHEGDVVAVAGVAVQVNLYHLRHLWVFDLVTTGSARSRGHGEELLRFLEDLAAREGCGIIALSSATRRVDAHRFYEQRMGYLRSGYTFQKVIEAR